MEGIVKLFGPVTYLLLSKICNLGIILQFLADFKSDFNLLENYETHEMFRDKMLQVFC